jgi:outer membrane receptor protein involved in Fe transport
MKNLLLGIFLIWSIPFSWAQEKITGHIMDSEGKGIAGVNIIWKETIIGTTTNKTGHFSIPQPPKDVNTLVLSHVGFETKYWTWKGQKSAHIQLTESSELEGIELVDKKNGISISNIDPIKTESVNEVELNKFACCDLAGSFATQQSVKTKTTNVITNAKELQLLGVSGVYNQVLFDGFPLQRGLQYTYGVSGFSGTLLRSIEVSKGANSALQDPTSIAGIINVRLKKPNDDEKFMANLFINQFGENHWNTHYSFSGKTWKNLIGLSMVQPAKRTDNNKDGFLDLPLLERYHFFNTFQYGNKKDWGWFSTTGIRFINENRIGGEIDFLHNHRGEKNKYGQDISFNQAELWSKNIYRWDDDHFLNFMVSGAYHDQESYFGTTRYDANQTLAYAKAMYSNSASEKHKWKIGSTFRLQDLDETITFLENSLKRTYAGNYITENTTLGTFGEHSTRFFNDRLTLNTGLRFDYHFQSDWYITPRILAKYDLNENASIRTSIGTGWRAPSIFSEQAKVLASGKDINIDPNISTEKGRNFGINYTHNYDWDNFVGYISADFYQTNFTDQLFVNYERDLNTIYIQNLSSGSRSRGGQVEFSTTFKENIDLKLAYTYTENTRKQNGERIKLPFYVPHRFGIAASFRTLEDKLHFDVNTHYNAAVKVPTNKFTSTKGENYWLLNGQVAYYKKRFKFYGGVENLLNYKMPNPILSSNNPFSKDFETAFAWGPIRGRELYLGITYKID